MNSRVIPWINGIRRQSEFGEFTLSAIIVTHYDSDHLQGIVDLLEEIKKADGEEVTAIATNPSYVRDNNSILNWFPKNATQIQKTRIYDVGIYKTSVDTGT
jgi:glyoxylase-like metal-dependent hydrolase (beta-lactamase superfamily II)